MSKVTSSMRDLARRLIVLESADCMSIDPKNPERFHVCDKLRPQLAMLMGNAGFRSLQARALALANAEVPWLREVKVGADGSLDGMEQLRAKLSEDELVEGRSVLLAQLLELLVAFIGERLTLRLVDESYPNASLNGHGFVKETRYEKKR